MFDTEESLPQTVSMRLKCGKCGHTAKYNLTRIYISPEALEAKGSEDRDESISFGDYFRCNKCGSAWPWELTSDAYLTLTALTLKHFSKLKEERLIFGIPQLFDGSPFHSAAQAEEYLQGLLEREPQNAFVWDRLGNVYEKAGLLKKATEAFTKALEINPKELESHFSLGYLSLEKGKDKKAAEHFHQVILLAWKNQKVPEKKLRELVYQTLGWLCSIADRSQGKISMFPPPAPALPADSDEPALVYMSEFDLGKEADRQRLVDMVLGKEFDDAAPCKGTAAKFHGGRKAGSLPRGDTEKRQAPPAEINNSFQKEQVYNMAAEDEYLDVLQNIEFMIVQTYRKHAELSDYEVLRIMEALIDDYRGNKIGRAPRRRQLSEREHNLMDAMRTVCDWRLGRETQSFAGALPTEALPQKPLTLDEIIACLRKLLKSAERWNKEGGRQGYLNFISQFVG